MDKQQTLGAETRPARTAENQGQVVIVGGGIAGLTAAYRLQALSRSTGAALRITLVEADNQLGGKLRTLRHGELLIEAGPDSFLAHKPAALALCEELGIGEQVINTRESGGGTFILRSGRLEPLPEGITMLVPTRFKPLLTSRLLSPLGKLRMGLELLVPARRDQGDESIGSFVRRRLGTEAFERMAQPLLSGIYSGDAEQLSILSTFPRLRETELRYGSLIRGMLAQRRAAQPAARSGARRTPFLSLAGGMSDLIAALERQLGDVDIRLGTAAVGLEPLGEQPYQVRLADGTLLPADAVLLAIPAYASAALLGEVDAELARVLHEIPYVSSATVMLAYRRAEVEAAGAGRGFVIPHAEQRELTAITWVTNKFPGRAPDDIALVRGFVGRAGRQQVLELSDDEIVQVVRRELREITGLSAEPVGTVVHRWFQAMPQYVVGHSARLADIDRKLRHLPGLYLLGAAYRGVGIPDCIQSGQQAAEQVAAQLGLGRTSV